MIIFAKLGAFASLSLKALAAAVIVLIAFRFYRVKSFFNTYLVFLFSSFLFLGIIIGLYLVFKSKLIVVNNSTVYFDIKARELLILALFAYAASSVIVRLYNRSVSRGELFMLEIFYGGESVSVFALSDTGNKLREPFSSGSVIVVKSEAAEDLFSGAPFRLIPASTVNSTTYLRAYKPDKTVLKNAKGEEVIENVYVALSDNIKSESYSAIINPEVLSI